MKTQGICSELHDEKDSSMLQMIWPQYSLTIIFGVKSDKNWFFKELGVTVEEDGNTLTAKKSYKGDENTQFFHAKAAYGYSCTQQDIVNLESNNGTFSVSFLEIEVQPFENGGNKTHNFNECSSKSESSNSSSVVPIAVGCALAGLIVIVLIAYLIGRRKNDGRGYQQV